MSHNALADPFRYRYSYGVAKGLVAKGIYSIDVITVLIWNGPPLRKSLKALTLERSESANPTVWVADVSAAPIRSSVPGATSVEAVS